VRGGRHRDLVRTYEAGGITFVLTVREREDGTHSWTIAPTGPRHSTGRYLTEHECLAGLFEALEAQD
jgi:hypothetical protein